ncbi:MAG TPA: type II toxin-antitoxin system VapC family toxin [Polyangiaceae bacterium]
MAAVDSAGRVLIPKVLDTNVYVAALRDERTFDRLVEMLARVMPHVWLSSVVEYELLSGARGDAGRATVQRLLRPLVRAGRRTAPAEADWERAGIAESEIWDAMPSQRSKPLANDLLIACTARRIGAKIVTENRRDFALIARHIQHTWLSSADLAVEVL